MPTNGTGSATAAALASVAFLKIHEFVRRPVTEQARLRAQLEAVIAVTVAELDPASRVLLDAADGVAVVVFDDPIGTMRSSPHLRRCSSRARSARRSPTRNPGSRRRC